MSLPSTSARSLGAVQEIFGSYLIDKWSLSCSIASLYMRSRRNFSNSYNIRKPGGRNIWSKLFQENVDGLDSSINEAVSIKRPGRWNKSPFSSTSCCWKIVDYCFNSKLSPDRRFKLSLNNLFFLLHKVQYFHTSVQAIQF